ncbi:MAG: recombinase family protein [Clostridia bacterium]|nr:recombinase family protein [Clostridia bacterium]
MEKTVKALPGKTVRTIPATLNQFTSCSLAEPKKRKACGYARVSTTNEDQQGSYEAQLDYYTTYIKSRPDLEFAGVYSDDGVSGTSTAKRKGFQQMVNDALAGKIDLVITKSLSRFARNTVDSISTIRLLKENGVECWFEKENLHSFDPKCELLVSIMSSLSQEESRSISQNVTWGQRKRMADGKVSVPFGRFLGYDRGPDGNLVKNEEQAVIVRRIYSLFLQGMTPYGIAKLLTKEGVKSPGGKDVWGGTTVKSILTCEKYKGDALLQKTFTTDYLTKKKKVNEGEVPQFYVANNHEPVIDPEVFDHVQREIARRSSFRQSGVHLFSAKIKCAECGSFYGPKVWHSNDQYRRVIWQCNHKFSKAQKAEKGADPHQAEKSTGSHQTEKDAGASEGQRKKHPPCGTPHLTEEQIQDAFVEAVNQVLCGRRAAIASFGAAKDIVFNTMEMEEETASLEAEMAITSERMNVMIRENATVAMDQDVYRRQFQALSDHYDALKERHRQLQHQITDKKNRCAEIDAYIRLLKKQHGRVEEFSAELWCGLLDYVTIGDDMKFTFKDGTEVSVKV